MSRRKFDYELYRKLRRDGKTLREIAVSMGVSVATVSRAGKDEAGVAMLSAAADNTITLGREIVQQLIQRVLAVVQLSDKWVRRLEVMADDDRMTLVKDLPADGIRYSQPHVRPQPTTADQSSLVIDDGRSGGPRQEILWGQREYYWNMDLAARIALLERWCGRLLSSCEAAVPLLERLYSMDACMQVLGTLLDRMEKYDPDVRREIFYGIRQDFPRRLAVGAG